MTTTTSTPSTRLHVREEQEEGDLLVMPLPTLRYHKSDYAVAGGTAPNSASTTEEEDEHELDDLLGDSSNVHHTNNNNNNNELIEQFMARMGLTGEGSVRQSLLSMTSSLTLTDFDELEEDDIYGDHVDHDDNFQQQQQQPLDQDNDCVPTCPARRVSLQQTSQHTTTSTTNHNTPSTIQTTTTTTTTTTDCMPKRPGRRTSETTCQSIPEDSIATPKEDVDELLTSLSGHHRVDAMPKRPRRRNSDSTCKSIPEGTAFCDLKDYVPIVPARRQSDNRSACKSSSIVSLRA
ncbi:expressed unknown protein [Seminavis robusta]|uniref:Uncharacterized protein n=1 Tax=Seminavis robusta TaxID=568900 RepID=A0A9N8F1N5_9STRA|nr:expressed unknown protein [Seminavis robusta]|eukprot:Sro3343_g347010.1 n/a (291) ;mRNA; f:5927-6799